eukprot:780093-Rhodomonas_salina.1
MSCLAASRSLRVAGNSASLRSTVKVPGHPSGSGCPGPHPPALVSAVGKVTVTPGEAGDRGQVEGGAVPPVG